MMFRASENVHTHTYTLTHVHITYSLSERIKHESE